MYFKRQEKNSILTKNLGSPFVSKILQSRLLSLRSFTLLKIKLSNKFTISEKKKKKRRNLKKDKNETAASLKKQIC